MSPRIRYNRLAASDHGIAHLLTRTGQRAQDGCGATGGRGAEGGRQGGGSDAVEGRPPTPRFRHLLPFPLQPLRTALLLLLHRVLAHLCSALSRLAEPPSLSAPSPISRLPAELVAHIVSFCQVDDLRLRQNTNLALASTCRKVHAATQPILRREMHLFTPGQLERVAVSVRAGERSAALVKTFTLDLPVEDLTVQANGSWPGRKVLPLLLSPPHIETLHMTLGVDLSQEASDELDHPATLRALAPPYPHTDDAEWYSFYDKAALRHLRLDLLVPRNTDHDEPYLSLAFCAPAALETLEIGNPARPEDHPRNLLAQQHRYLPSEPPPHILPSRLRRLVIPWYHIHPTELLSVLSPKDLDDPSRPAPRLAHLEILLDMQGTLQQLIADIEAIFTALSPTIRHLVLRLHPDERLSGAEGDKFVRALSAGIGRCTLLEHLEIGGAELFSPRYGGRDTLSRQSLPSLTSLTFLPYTPISDVLHFDYRQFPLLKRVTVCVPSLADWDAWSEDGAEDLRFALEEGEGAGVEMVLEIREAEGEWWRRHGF